VNDIFALCRPCALLPAIIPPAPSPRYSIKFPFETPASERNLAGCIGDVVFSDKNSPASTYGFRKLTNRPLVYFVRESKHEFPYLRTSFTTDELANCSGIRSLYPRTVIRPIYIYIYINVRTSRIRRRVFEKKPARYFDTYSYAKRVIAGNNTYRTV